MSLIDRPITDSEIVLAEELFLPKEAFFNKDRREVIKNTETINIKAAPGSGKTTVLLTKLFILAQRMPFKDNKGICVLTHTNVAIDEIKERLGSKADLLFSYPNFFGTFQSFVNKFLAIPYYSLTTNSRSINIDENYYIEKINKQVNFSLNGFTQETQKKARYFLNSRRGLLNTIRLNFSDGKLTITEGITGKEVNIKRPSRSLIKKGDFTEEEKNEIDKWIKLLKFKLLSDGVLSYDDAYYLANRYIIKYQEQLKALFSNRFKFVFIDESQDTYSHQRTIIDHLFNEDVIIQSFGDPNQSIFDSKNIDSSSTHDPNEGNYINIQQSQRFGMKIAEKLKTICVEENNPIEGSLTINSIKPHIILFKENESTLVLEKFSELIKKNNLLSPNAKRHNDFKAIGWRGNTTDDVLKKLCLQSYFPDFDKRKSNNKSVHYNNLISYIKKMPDEFIKNQGVKVYYDSILNCITSYLFLTNIRNSNEKKEARYFNKSTLTEYLYENKYDEYIHLKLKISEWILAINSNKDTYNYDVYNSIKEYLTNDINLIFPKIQFSKEVEFFLNEFPPEINDLVSENQNIYTSTVVPEIQIMLDTVHSVKGETHKATLYLETFNNKHDLENILPFLKGQYDKKLVEKKQINAALKVAYVGMSRPTHLLCLAMRLEALNESDILELKSAGWELDYIVESSI